LWQGVPGSEWFPGKGGLHFPGVDLTKLYRGSRNENRDKPL